MNITGNVSSGGGDVAQTIYKQGFDIRDIQELIDVLKQALPNNDPRPEQFEKMFEELHKLYEWKELHNALDDILSSFAPFHSEIQRVTAEKFVRVESLKKLWIDVSVQIDVLIEFARGIQLIGIPYREHKNGNLTGDAWAVNTHNLRVQINNQLGLGEFYSEVEYGSIRDGRVREEQIRVLLDLTNEFKSRIYSHMHITDKKLCDCANELYTVSKSIFGS